MNEFLNLALIRPIVEQALREDIGSGDITTKSISQPESQVKAVIFSKQSGIIAGLPVAELAFKILDETISFNPLLEEGAQVFSGDKIAELQGKASAILSAERTALNFLQHLSGIATKTRRFVELTAHYKAKIMDTRKTTPGLRILEKYAVRVAGGKNHRMGLYDGILIKDNHIKVAGGIKKAVEIARQKAPMGMKIEVETKSIAEVEEALASQADIIMLDNMDLETMREAVRKISGRAEIEASGGIAEENITEIAQTGVDYISIGALTHSVQALDMSLEIIEEI